MRSPEIIVVDADADGSGQVLGLLEREGLDALLLTRGREAVEMCGRSKDRVILASSDLPDMDGMTFLREAFYEGNRNLFLMLADDKGTLNREKMIQWGAFAVLRKPVEADRLVLAVRGALARRNLRRRIDSLKRLTAFLILMIPLVTTAGILLAIG